MHYLLEAERDLAVANCRELLRVTQDPLLRVELQIAALSARTGRSRRIPDLNQPGASISATHPRADATSAFPGRPRHFFPR